MQIEQFWVLLGNERLFTPKCSEHKFPRNYLAKEIISLSLLTEMILGNTIVAFLSREAASKFKVNMEFEIFANYRSDRAERAYSPRSSQQLPRYGLPRPGPHLVAARTQRYCPRLFANLTSANDARGTHASLVQCSRALLDSRLATLPLCL